MSEVDELGEALRHAVSRECPECSLENLSLADACERCGHTLPPLEEERRVSFREGGLVYDKTALEDSWNLKVLRAAQEALQAGSIDTAEYRQHVGKILEAAREFLEALEDQAEQYEGLDETSQSILGRTLVHYQAFVAGCERMMEGDTAHLAAAVDGLGLVQQALAGLDRVEDEATDHLREMAEALPAEPEEEEEPAAEEAFPPEGEPAAPEEEAQE